MSAALLKEFDVFYQSTSVNTTCTTSLRSVVTPVPFQTAAAVGRQRIGSDLSSTSYADLWGFGDQSGVKPTIPQKHESLTSNVIDDWGGFEAVEVEKTISEVACLKEKDETTIISDIWTISSDESYPITTVKPVTTSSLGRSTTVLPIDQAPVGAKALRSADVLFDAEDEDNEEDDFGDYEGLSELAIPARLSDASACSSFSEISPPSVLSRSQTLQFQKGHENSPDTQQHSVASLRGAGSTTTILGRAKKTITSRPSPHLPSPSEQSVQRGSTTRSPSRQSSEDDEPWPEFTESLPAATNKIKSTRKRLGSAMETKMQNPATADSISPDCGSALLDLVTALPAKKIMLNDTNVGSLNIPPPVVIIPLFSTIMNITKDRFFEPLGMRSSSSAVPMAVLRDIRTHDFLKAYILISTVLGYVIAGRKHRWKRDKLLTQSMRIGPASSSGKSGMKLVGFDKCEDTREEKEVADIIIAWRAQSGKLRYAVSGAGISETVPELAEFLVVRSGTSAEGAMTSKQACALCGLRREERVRKVDVKVEDSFGEWWIEHWGHRACRNFWAAQRDILAK